MRSWVHASWHEALKTSKEKKLTPQEIFKIHCVCNLYASRINELDEVKNPGGGALADSTKWLKPPTVETLTLDFGR